MLIILSLIYLLVGSGLLILSYQERASEDADSATIFVYNNGVAVFYFFSIMLAIVHLLRALKGGVL